MKTRLAFVTLLLATTSCAALLGTDLDGLRPKEDDAGAGANEASSPDSPGGGEAGADGASDGTTPTGEADRRQAQWPVPVTSPPASAYHQTTETIEDTVTGLVWQRAIPEAVQDFDAALAYCANLTYAGHGDWRLPTRIELVSIIDYGATSTPMVAAVGFDGSAAAPSAMTYWTSSVLVGSTTTSRFAVDFAKADVKPLPSSSDALVRCVRAGKVGAGPRWTSTGSTVKDAFTNLEWRNAGVVYPVAERPNRGPLEEATKACADLTVAGGGFRLPAIREVHTLYDELAPASSATRLDAVIPWKNTAPTLWSATLVAVQPSRAYVVDFNAAITFDTSVEAQWQALCVR